MKIGFIGAGNMAQGIINGLKAAKHPFAKDIQVTASTPERSKKIAAKLDVIGAINNESLVNDVDLLVLAVKPPMIPEVLTPLVPLIAAKQPIILSIAAGLTLANLEAILGNNPRSKIIRAMPNMNVTIGRSVTALCGNDLISENEMNTILELFETVGSAYKLPEKDFRNFTSLAGCSPAFTYLYIDAMSRAGVKNGLPKEIATKIATESVLGSAEMLLASAEETPWDLIDKVCSPGGTTIEGLVSLEEDAFVATVIKALDATIKKDKELEN